MRMALQWGLDIEFNFRSISRNWSFGTDAKKKTSVSLPAMSQHLQKDIGYEVTQFQNKDYQKFL